MVGEGDIHHRNVFYRYIYISVCVCVLGSTAAAWLLRSRKLKLCQTKLELFVSLSLLLLVLAGSACTEFKTCLSWDVEGMFLEGSMGWDISSSVCRVALCCSWCRDSQVSPDLPLPCSCTISLSALTACRGHSPTPESGFPSPARGRSREALIPLVAKCGLSAVKSATHGQVIPKLRVQ